MTGRYGACTKGGSLVTIFLLDKQGRIRWKRVGEGDYDEAERLIQKLLTET